MCSFHFLHSHFLLVLRVSFFFVFQFIFPIQIPTGYGHNTLMRALIGCVYVPSRPIPFSRKTDTGRISGMYICFVDLYTGPFAHCCHLISDKSDDGSASNIADARELGVAYRYGRLEAGIQNSSKWRTFLFMTYLYGLDPVSFKS